MAPNVDTLYSIAHLDLGRGPVVLGHPAMGHRYFVFQLLDPYTDTIAYIGSRTTGSRAGRFAITWTGHRGKLVAGARVISSRYRRLWVIGRTLASDTTDQRKAAALMRKYTLTPPGGAHSYAGCHPGRVTDATTPTGLAFLDALGKALKDNPPPAADRPLLAKLAEVGVGPGLAPEKVVPAGVLNALTASVTPPGSCSQHWPRTRSTLRPSPITAGRSRTPTSATTEPTTPTGRASRSSGWGPTPRPRRSTPPA